MAEAAKSTSGRAIVVCDRAPAISFQFIFQSETADSAWAIRRQVLKVIWLIDLRRAN